MKIGLVVPANLQYSPYVKYYTDILDRENADYRVMSWNKLAKEEQADMIYTFYDPERGWREKLYGYFMFSRKCKAYIKKEKFDRLIIFTIVPLYFMGYRYLKKFRDRLLIDIRDDSPFRRLFPRKLPKVGALASTLIISSPFYADWFSRQGFMCHNVEKSMVEAYGAPYGKDRINRPISLVFAGKMLEENINIQVIGKLADSEDFKLAFIGRDNDRKDKIKQYVQEHKIRNVTFEGEYQKEEIVGIYRSKADIVNIFREDTVINRNALPNKLYDAVLSGIPVAVYDHNIAIANYVNQYNLGVVLTEKDDLKEQLFNYANTFDAEAYRTGRSAFLSQVQKDIAAFEEKVTAFCRG